MALIFCDGFDHYDTAHRQQKWDYFVDFYNQVSINPTKGRRGTGAMEFQNQYEDAQKAIPQTSTLIMGVAYNPQSTFWSWGGHLLRAYGTYGELLCSVFVTGSGVIEFHCGTGPSTYGAYPGSQAAKPLRNGLYQYLEWKVTFGASNGTVTVRLNEETIISLSELDTGGGYSNRAYTTCAKVGIGVANGTWARTEITLWADDVYVCDATGSFCNDFLGDVSVEERLPVADGFYADFETSSSADHFTEVNDAYNQLDTATKVWEKTVGSKDTYLFDDLRSQGGEVKAVVINYYASKADSGYRKIRGLSRLGGADGLGTEITMGETMAFYQSVLYQTPAASDWTIATVNDAEFGQQISA